jgi:hypothetical protein
MTPTERMARNMPISPSAVSPSSTYTTAHGYMNIISISKAMNNRVMG